MWNAFSGYTDVYGELPDDEEVQRVRLYLAELGKYEKEVQEADRAKQEEIYRNLQQR